MSKPILPLPGTIPPGAGATTGEGAQTALAAMIRKRKMGENHVEQDRQDKLPSQPATKP